jgi:hypothetical protein
MPGQVKVVSTDYLPSYPSNRLERWIGRRRQATTSWETDPVKDEWGVTQPRRHVASDQWHLDGSRWDVLWQPRCNLWLEHGPSCKTDVMGHRLAMMKPESMVDLGDSVDNPTLCTLASRLYKNRWLTLPPPLMGYKRRTTPLYGDSNTFVGTLAFNNPVQAPYTWASETQ